MKSFLILLTLYILMIVYGQGLPELKKNKEVAFLTFNKNTIYLSDSSGSQNIEIKCQELITSVTQQTHCTKMEIHLQKGSDLKLKGKTSQIEKDVFIRAEQGRFQRSEKIIHLSEFFDLTYGDDCYLTSQNAEWDINKQIIKMPNIFYLQRGKDQFNGENGIFDLKDSKITFDKNISCKINNIRWGESEVLEISSKGSLTYFEKEGVMTLKDTTTISNQQYYLNAGTIKVQLDTNNQIETILANNRVDLKIKNKNIKAQAEQAIIKYNQGIFILETVNGIEPHIDINGFRQTAHIITYNEKEDTLTAGPTVKSVRINDEK